MVRLLPTMTTSLTTTCKFQSHNGAIAARNLFSCFPQTAVSIPQWCDCCRVVSRSARTRCFSFNPTMVRLLPNYIDKFCATFHQFQSHNGAIAARELAWERLEALHVSIPQWCDCCA